MRAGRFREALPKLLRATQFTPEMAALHYYLGRCYGASERYEEALTSFQKAAALKPELRGMREYAEDVEATKREARWKKEGILTHMKRGSPLLERQGFHKAPESYRAALKINGKSEDALFNVGVILGHRGRTAEARKALAEVLRLNPQHPGAGRVLSRL